MNCEKIQVLLSKYADSEAAPAEQESVRVHISDCARCARKLAEYEQVSAIFSSSPTIPPEPQLRVKVFREINLLKEDERRKARRTRDNRPWYMPSAEIAPTRSIIGRLLAIFNPAVAIMLAAFTLFGLIALNNRPPSQLNPEEVSQNSPPLSIPTIAASVFVDEGNSTAVAAGLASPGPEETKSSPAVFSPIAAGNATMLPTVTGEGLLLLSNATPVMELPQGHPNADGRPLYVVRDAAYGYSISYPPNWWTQLVDGVRYFRPWITVGAGSTPYWIEMRVEANSENYTAESFNRTTLEGSGHVVGGTRLRNVSSDDDYAYDELYSFDRKYIYNLRLIVPRGSLLPDFAERWRDAENVYTAMTGQTRLSPEQPASAGGAGVLFLNGDDLFTVTLQGQARAVTHGGLLVRQFSLSPDSRYAAFTAVTPKERTDLWPHYLYVVDLYADSLDAPRSLWSSVAEIRDIVWYNDRTLLALAKTFNGSGLYRISLPEDGEPFDPATMVRQITDLSGSAMAGAKALAVGPDRQLITFLAPFGESKGTDLYAVRPDGSDLRLIMSHTEPVAPSAPDDPDEPSSGTRILSPENQAIKSYTWISGHLDRGGYRYSLLFTCGNAVYPSLYKGGFLYSAPSEANAPLLDTRLLEELGVADPAKLQIIHVAYSTNGKVAMTGYYNDVEEERADKLAGLWVAEIVGGQLISMEPQPMPAPPNGITDLQWSPNNSSLIYRETIPQRPDSLTSKYDGVSPFNIVKQNLTSGERVTLYSRN